MKLPNTRQLQFNRPHIVPLAACAIVLASTQASCAANIESVRAPITIVTQSPSATPPSTPQKSPEKTLLSKDTCQAAQVLLDQLTWRGAIPFKISEDSSSALYATEDISALSASISMDGEYPATDGNFDVLAAVSASNELQVKVNMVFDTLNQNEQPPYSGTAIQWVNAQNELTLVPLHAQAVRATKKVVNQDC